MYVQNNKKLFLFRKQIRKRKHNYSEKPVLNLKIALIETIIVTAAIGVYGIELGIHVLTKNERPEILAVVIIVLVLLFFVNLILLAKYKNG
jgi:hypothetical protein